MKDSLLKEVDSKGRNPVSLTIANGIAVIAINNPPVNAGSHPVRAGIVESLKGCTSASLKAVVIIGEGRGFSGGSDVKEFGTKLLPPEVPDVIRAIEQHPIPVIAAIHGIALGGGLELALGCDYRVGKSGALVALPEVLLGMIPGAGGTQRLPRLIGKLKALDLICSGKRVTSEMALSMGFIDSVCIGDLLSGVIHFIEDNHPLDKRLSIEQSVPVDSESELNAAIFKIKQRNKGRENISEAIRLVQASSNDHAEATLIDERQTFNKLRLSEDAFALRYLFFAEKTASRIEAINDTKATKITYVGIVGGGTMGQGIAKAVLNAGLKVVLIERDSESSERAFQAIKTSYENLEKKGIYRPDQVQNYLDNLSSTVGFEAVTECELIIEAVFEDMQIKKALLEDLDAIVPRATILATNTSYLDINQMSENLKHRERVVGLHFFSPADRMKLLEVIRAEQTSESVLATSLAFSKRLGKQTVVANVAEGFIGNRIYAAYRRRAELLVLDGACPYEVDKAIKNFGFAMGPFEVSDLSGLDIAWAMRKRKASDRDPNERYVTLADSLCVAGHFGRKTGQGWYSYQDKTALPSEFVKTLINETRTNQGIEIQNYDESEIQQQLLVSMVNEAACLIHEGVAQRASDIDVAITNGYGFPRHKGGPIYWASQQDPIHLTKILQQLSNSVGHGFKTGPVSEIVSFLTQKGGQSNA
ncbi:3-hydroxyacyl-CoA dehydrogenase [Marinomonas balearica]|uniref:3-hydroxyacyl-CoA dehydrogenase n=2 Tax=Marinomonas balearica TaxID=491947 RepID=A0A4R6MHH3_9GAMM|nr:3-hydroxyacyl-CoA dehydrogenase [Marinomonas balearica]